MAENHDVEVEEACRQQGCWRALLGGAVVSRIWTRRAWGSFSLGKRARITRRRHERARRAQRCSLTFRRVWWHRTAGPGKDTRLLGGLAVAAAKTHLSPKNRCRAPAFAGALTKGHSLVDQPYLQILRQPCKSALDFLGRATCGGSRALRGARLGKIQECHHLGVRQGFLFQ